jgi:hypothetical protein
VTTGYKKRAGDKKLLPFFGDSIPKLLQICTKTSIVQS